MAPLTAISRNFSSVAVMLLLVFSALVITEFAWAAGEEDRAQPIKASTQVIRFGMTLPMGGYPWRLAELIYSEAFARLGYKFELHGFPLERSLMEADSGRMDGEVGRIQFNSALRAKYPHLIRVAESVYQMKVTAFAVDPDIRLDSWEDIDRKKLTAGFPRGQKASETNLNARVDKKHIIETPGIPQGLEMLKRRRIDVLVAAQDSVLLVLAEPEWKDQAIQIAGVLESVPLFPYLYEKHSALVPRLAAALKLMKEDGTFNRLDEKAKTMAQTKKEVR